MADLSFFISYAHEDKSIAISLDESLKLRGCAVWLDQNELEIGDSLATRIPEAILSIEFFIVLVSKSSVGSSWCQKELSLAVTDGLANSKVKVLPVRVDGADMPAAISDLLYVDVDDKSVDAAAEALVKSAKSHLNRPPREPSSEPKLSRSRDASLNSHSDSGGQNGGAIKIVGVVAEKVGRPRSDGSRGSALYAVPIRLSRRPDSLWSEVFVATWDHPPSFTTMHRPGIARVVGDTIILDGTTVEEVERYHAETLRIVIPRVNEIVASEQEKRRLADERHAAEVKAHEASVREAAGRIKFD